MAHIALFEGAADGNDGSWREHVTDEQYTAAATAITEA